MRPLRGRFDSAAWCGYKFTLVSEDLFPSGPWVGFYTYVPNDKHRMDLHLDFANGNMSGDGNDDVGRFLIKGRYDTQTRECYWTKRYVGAHDVFYEGYREGKGIWGRWEIGAFAHGGFHIWPRSAGEGETKAEAIEQPAPVEAIGKEETVGTSARSSGVRPECEC